MSPATGKSLRFWRKRGTGPAEREGNILIEEPEKTVWHLTKSPLGRAGIKKGLGIAQVLSLSVFVVSPWRFERQAYSSGGCRSIQLSYGPTGGGFPTGARYALLRAACQPHFPPVVRQIPDRAIR